MLQNPSIFDINSKALCLSANFNSMISSVTILSSPASKLLVDRLNPVISLRTSIGNSLSSPADNSNVSVMSEKAKSLSACTTEIAVIPTAFPTSFLYASM